MQKRKIFYSKLFDKLFPIPRSITGTGYRNSLKLSRNIYHLKF